MKRLICEMLIGLSIGGTLGAMHVQSTKPEYTTAHIMPKTEPIPVEEEEEIPQGADHYLHDMGYILDTEIPQEIQEAAEQIGWEYQISPEFLESMAYQESRFTANIVSSDGSCIGLMQVNPRWHKDRMKRLNVSKEELKTVRGNMLVAADYLRELFETYEDPAIVLMKYNGDKRADAYAESGRVSTYAREILERSAEYEEKHGK